MGTESVSEWGARWLAEWENAADVPEADRDTRAWLAETWRNWTLDDAVHEWGADGRRWSGLGKDAHDANHAARGLVNLYLRERAGLLVWRMYSEYRRRGVEVPEYILAKFDQWAKRLETASGPRAVAAAIEMTGERGGAQGAAHLRHIERAWYIVSEVENLRGLGLTKAEAFRRVAVPRGMRIDAVKAMHRRWFASRAKGERDADRVLRTLGRR